MLGPRAMAGMMAGGAKVREGLGTNRRTGFRRWTFY